MPQPQADDQTRSDATHSAHPGAVQTAQADVLGPATSSTGVPDTAGVMPAAPGVLPAAPEAGDAPADSAGDGQALPGKDENQAGFLKHPDATKPTA